MRTELLRRRDLLRAAAAAAIALGASPFWVRKQASEWSASEIEQLKTNSPWAKKVSIDLSGAKNAGVQRMETTGSVGTFGGMHGADSNGISVSGRGSRNVAPGTQGPEVIVRWESAKPMLDATRWAVPAAFENSYAVSITGLPPAILIVAVAGRNPREDAEVTPEEAAVRQRASVQRLLAGTTLTAKGYAPQAAAFVVQSADHASLVFGFEKAALPFHSSDKDVVFRMALGVAAIQAKFEPKEMVVNGQLAL